MSQEWSTKQENMDTSTPIGLRDQPIISVVLINVLFEIRIEIRIFTLTIVRT
jgi:hypothetical protein